MSGMPDMTPTSLAATVAPRTGKIIKNGVRNRVAKLKFTHAENRLFWKGLGTLRVKKKW